MFQRLIQQNRSAADRTRRFRRCFSALLYAQYKVTLPLILDRARGRLIDLGAGEMPYRETIEPSVDRYESLDRTSENPALDYIGDIQALSKTLPADAYDTVLMLEVLEHLPDPGRALREVHRILAVGGMVVLSAPHLSRIHERPHDFFRFTEYGLSTLLKNAGFIDIEVRRRGGLFCFLCHQVSTILLGLTLHIPVINYAVYGINAVLFVLPAFWIDQVIDRNGVFAAGYVVAARK